MTFFTVLGAGAIFSWLLFLLPGILLFFAVVAIAAVIMNEIDD